MSAAIYIVSGFLGAGKTTLIQKLLQEAFSGAKVAIVENDFGDVSIDSALLKSSGFTVTEINSGCICCSLSGDFVASLAQLLLSVQPDVVVIEPSGVGKLSEIEASCRDPRIASLAKIQSKIAVVDVKRCRMYLENFGEFFEDQVAHADVVLLSRTDEYPDRIADATCLIQGLNGSAAILAEPLHQLTASDILGHGQSASGPEHCHAPDCDCCACGHDDHAHSAEEAFETVTVATRRVFTEEDLREKAQALSRLSGSILRAKGIVRGCDGFLHLEYLPGEVQITRSDVDGNTLCFIGSELDERELTGLFCTVH